MKKILVTLGFIGLSVLSGCAVVPAYGPTYYDPAPYYGPRYYGPPAVVVPGPVIAPRYGYHGWRHY